MARVPPLSKAARYRPVGDLTLAASRKPANISTFEISISNMRHLRRDEIYDPSSQPGSPTPPKHRAKPKGVHEVGPMAQFDSGDVLKRMKHYLNIVLFLLVLGLVAWGIIHFNQEFQPSF